MDYFLLIASVAFIILGYIGAFAPGISGPPMAWIGLLIIAYIDSIHIPTWVLITTGVIAGISFILEITIPAYGTKVFNGSKYGVRGSYLGMIAGLLLPIPFGFIIGPFVGAYLGEVLYGAKDHLGALKAATGTFLGFIVAILMNFAFVSLIAIIWGYYIFYGIINA